MPLEKYLSLLVIVSSSLQIYYVCLYNAAEKTKKRKKTSKLTMVKARKRTANAKSGAVLDETVPNTSASKRDNESKTVQKSTKKTSKKQKTSLVCEPNHTLPKNNTKTKKKGEDCTQMNTKDQNLQSVIPEQQIHVISEADSQNAGVLAKSDIDGSDLVVKEPSPAAVRPYAIRKREEII
jgi:hypothetical protein